MKRGALAAEAGLVGKAIVLTLVLLAVLGVAVFDAATVLIARYRAADLAERATYEARQVYVRSEDRRAACTAAAATVESRDPAARIPEGGCVVDTFDDQLTVTVRKTASTLVVRRLSFLRHYGKVEASESLPLSP